MEASFSSSVPHQRVRGPSARKINKIKGAELTLELPLPSQGIDPGSLDRLEGLVQGALCLNQLHSNGLGSDRRLFSPRKEGIPLTGHPGQLLL